MAPLVPAPADATPAPLPDRPAPDFTLPTLDGTTVTLSELKGQVALINVWATWCPPCRAEMPTIQATYEQYREQGFTVLAVDLQEDPRTVAGFMREFKLTFPALLGAIFIALLQNYMLLHSFTQGQRMLVVGCLVAIATLGFHMLQRSRA